MNYSGDALQWHKLTLEFDGPLLTESSKTFTDYRLDVTFTHESGMQITVPGYFAADGDAANTGATAGTQWNVHFNAPLEGNWSWDASFVAGDNIAVSTASGASAGHFDGASGSIEIAPSDKSGDDLRAKGMLEYDGDRYLNFAETGEIFLKSGVGSPENFLAYSGFDNTPDSHYYTPHIGDYDSGDPTWKGGEGKGIIGAVNYLAENDVNSAYMMLMNIGGDGRDVSPWSDTSLYDIPKNPGDPNLGDRVLSFDVSKLEQWEVVFGHMQEQGITLHLFLQETENDQMLDGGDLGVERMLYYREMVARFGHHNGLIWNLGEENTNTAGQLGNHSAYLKSIDPYDHPVALHTFPNQHDKYEDFEGTETLDVLSFQTSSDTSVPDLDRYLGGAENAGQPVVAFLDEPGDPVQGLAAEGDSGWESNHEDLREVLYEFYAEGGSGAEWYFGYNSAGGTGGDLLMEDFALRESAYEWSASAREFYAKLPLEEMRDGDDLTSGAQSHGLALDGEIYAYYLPDGGNLNLNLSGQSGTYKVGWYDPVEGGNFIAGSVGSVSGGSNVSIGAPPSSLSSEAAVMIWNTASYSFPVDDDLSGDGANAIEVALYLVDTTTDETIATLQPGDTLPGEVLDRTDVSIVAEVNQSVGSVRLMLGDHSIVENAAPYALFGDNYGDFSDPASAPFDSAGSYSVGVDVFSGTNATGSLLASKTYALELEGNDDTGGAGETGSEADTDGDNVPTTDATWVAKNGTVVMQAEKGIFSDSGDSSNGNWVYDDSLPGHTGDGYLHWNGPNLYGAPGSGTLSYEFEVTEAGNYELGLLASRPANGQASDLNNDFWVRTDGGEWTKLFFNGARETWSWATKFDINHTYPTASYDLDAGVHTLEISGRSEDTYLDKIHLSLGTLNADKALAETLADGSGGGGEEPIPTNTAPIIDSTDIALEEDGSVLISATDVASDADGDTLTIALLSGAGNGIATQVNSSQIRYVPDQDFSGSDEISVRISDGQGGNIETTLEIMVAPADEPVESGPDAPDEPVGPELPEEPVEPEAPEEAEDNTPPPVTQSAESKNFIEKLFDILLKIFGLGSDDDPAPMTEEASGEAPLLSDLVPVTELLDEDMTLNDDMDDDDIIEN